MAHAFHVIHHELHSEKLDYHSLHHTHASMLLEKGASPKAVTERLGHKNMKVTMETKKKVVTEYIHGHGGVHFLTKKYGIPNHAHVNPHQKLISLIYKKSLFL